MSPGPFVPGIAGRLDELLRERVFQRLADAARDRSGASCFALAGQAALAIPGAAVVWAGARLMAEGRLAGVVVVCLVLSLICGATYYGAAAAADRAFAARQAMPPPPPIFFRLFFAGAVLCDGFDIAADAWLTAATLAVSAAHLPQDLAFLSYFYFMACRPKPPSRRPRERRQGSRVLSPRRTAPAGAS